MASGALVDGSRPVGDATLTKIVRNLEKGTQPTTEKLSIVWKALSSTSGGSFHASEEVVLRWLLKNMKAETTEGECFRRYPLVWNILGCVFTRIPLFSLAKSLSERQFLPVLRQSFTEFAKPRGGPVSEAMDVEMVDAPADREVSATRKRKRSSPATFDLQTLREPSRYLESAASAFDAVRILLERIEVVVKGSSHEKMGAEHVKSLFSASAKDAAELIRPMVDLCDLALFEQITEPLENQKSWTTLIQGIWDFHLQGQQDAYEAATALSQNLCSILSKLLGYRKQQELSIDPHVNLAWTKDLRRFFIKVMITPARSSFLNRKDVSVLEVAVEIVKSQMTTTAPVFFDLVLQAPLIVREATAKKDNEEWTQKVFDLLEEPLRDANSLERFQVVNNMLRMVCDHGIRLSPDTLRAVCNNYALSGNVNWEILSRVAVADTDVFLTSHEGLDLLNKVLDQTTNLEAVNPDHHHLKKFIISLAKGFSRSRDLSGFIKKWFEYLEATLRDHKATGSILIWLDQEIQDEVSNLLQVSMTTRQLTSLLDWLDGHKGTSQNEALLVVLDTISRGISEEEFIDTIDTRLFDSVFDRKLSASALQKVASLRWAITRRTLSWVTSGQSQQIWDKIRPELTKQLKNGSHSEDVILESFRCAYAAWISNYPGGSYETEASSMVSDFLDKLNTTQSKKNGDVEPEALKQVLSECPRLLDLASKKFGQSPKVLHPNIPQVADRRYSETDNLARILSNEHNLNNKSFISNLIRGMVQSLSTGAGYQLNDIGVAGTTLFEALLHMPQECFTRDQRELIMSSLLKLVRSQKPHKQDKGGPNHWKLLLSLMTKLMRRPTFYENMSFTDLVTVGDVLMTSFVRVAHRDSPAVYETLRLFAEFANLTLRQMTSNIDTRENKYLSEAADVIASWSAQGMSSSHTIQLLLSSAVTTALEVSPNFQSLKQPPIDMKVVKQKLSAEVSAFLQDLHLADKSNAVVLVGLEEINAASSLAIQGHELSKLEDLNPIAEKFCTQGLKAGWKLKTFLVRHSKHYLGQTFTLQLEKASSLQGHSVWRKSGDATFDADRDDVLEYINTAIEGLDHTQQLLQLKELLAGLSANSAPFGKLLAVRRFVDIHAGSDTQASSRIDSFDLATAQSVLSRHLIQANTQADFLLTTQIMHTLLDKRASEMSQWNIEVTLSSVSTICAQHTEEAKPSRQGYNLLCRLVEIIIKRHRLRLEGHFHLLISVLQSLLTDLLSRNNDETAVISRRDDAKSYSRLLTLVCEPTVASVTRSQPTSLDSATDAAKRLAGQHMYNVLMLYIKLELEQSVPHDVREALEPGIYSILDVSPMEIRRIMNDAMDGSGRAIFRELYKQYLKFGKWSGI